MILDVTFEQIEDELDVQFDAEDDFEVDFGELSEIPPEDLPTYEGNHSIVPSFADQLLDTSGLLVEEDIKIEAIPLVRVSNNSGGMTVIIGG